MKKKFFTILTTGLIIFFASETAYADPSRGETRTPDSSRDRLQVQIHQAESVIEQYDSQIEDIMYDLEEINNEMSQIQSDILISEEELKSVEDSINESKDQFDSRMAAVYVNGPGSYLSVLLDSTSFSDFISRVDTLKTIIEFDTSIMEDLNEKRETIASKKSHLENKKDTLEQLGIEVHEKLTKLNNLKSEQQKLIDSLKAKLPKENAQEAFNIPLGTSFGDNIVAFALRFRGVPYVWGGNSPNGFDCSGFTKYVFGNFGINLERRASFQAEHGIPIAYNDLKPGDLVFFGTRIHHVGIYVGNDMFIHAPHTGEVVKITPMRYMDFNCARRMSP